MTLTSMMSQKAYNTSMSAHTMVNSFAEFVINICQQTVCLPQATESPTKHTHAESTSCLCCKGDLLTQMNILDCTINVLVTGLYNR